MSEPVVSVIIPYCQEWPQIVFTLRAVHEELLGIPHEVIAADNMCHQALDQMRNIRKKKGIPQYIDEGHDRPDDKTLDPPSAEWFDSLLRGELADYGESRVRGATRVATWLRWVRYADKLSHWNAKNAAVAASRGRLLLCVDAHVVPARGSLSGMVASYDALAAAAGPCSLHAPLTYTILDEHRLMYKRVAEPARGELAYSFTGYQTEWDATGEPREVPCASCCGVLISREVYDLLGGWPEELGIYGGGEHFLNFTGAVLGVRHFVAAGPALHHHTTHRGRGYHYEWGDYHRNRAIAAYTYGDQRWLEAYCRGHAKYARVPEFFELLIREIPPLLAEHREHVRTHQKMEVEEWLRRWTDARS